MLVMFRFDMLMRRFVIVPMSNPMNVRHKVMCLPEEQDYDQEDLPQKRHFRQYDAKAVPPKARR